MNKLKSPAVYPVDARVLPESCESMDEVRAGVDALDRTLVAMLFERQRYMEAAARIKPDRQAVHDDWRINDVLGKVAEEAARTGLSADIAEPVWRALIAACIRHEFAVYDLTRADDEP